MIRKDLDIQIEDTFNKKTYEKPVLEMKGDIAELTRSVAGAPEDVQITGQLGSSSQG